MKLATRLLLLIAAALGSLVLLNIGVSALQGTPIPTQSKYHASLLLLISGGAFFGVLLSLFAKNWLKKSKKIRLFLIALVMCLPVLDLFMLPLNTAEAKLVISHVAGSLFLSLLIALAISTAWLGWFQGRPTTDSQ